ncbi:alpha/beta hydrolase family protein [candidate division KSB1 bacterium]
MKKLPYSRIIRLILWLILSASYSLLSAQEKVGFAKPMSDESWDVLQEFFQYDKSIPLNARVVSTQEIDFCTRHKIVFTSVRNERVPGLLALPKTGEAPYPLIIGCHGGYGSKDNFWDAIYKHSFLEPMISAGYAVFILDAVYHGDRISGNDYDDLHIILNEGLKYTFSDLLIHTAIDNRRALDYLATRSDIDMNRIGVFGHSMGGIMTFLLTAVDERIKVSVPCVGPPQYFTMSYPTYLVHYAARINDRPVLMLMGKSDPTYTIEEAEYLYKNINSKTKNIIWFESGHSLPPEWGNEAVKWFKTHLK